MRKLSVFVAVVLGLTLPSGCSMATDSDLDTSSLLVEDNDALTNEEESEQSQEDEEQEETLLTNPPEEEEKDEDSNEDSQAEENQEEDSNELLISDSGSSVNSSKETCPFQSGVWMGCSEQYGLRYFCFYDNAGNGDVLFQNDGTGEGFSSEYTEEHFTVHLGDIENSNTLMISTKSDDSIIGMWDDGAYETFLYVSDDCDNFTFYSNEELEEMALNYYEMENDYRPQYAASSDDGTGEITIQLYDLVEDHTSTSDWYYIDPVTGAGTNLMGNDVDLTEAPLG